MELKFKKIKEQALAELKKIASSEELKKCKPSIWAEKAS